MRFTHLLTGAAVASAATLAPTMAGAEIIDLVRLETRSTLGVSRNASLIGAAHAGEMSPVWNGTAPGRFAPVFHFYSVDLRNLAAQPLPTLFGSSDGPARVTPDRAVTNRGQADAHRPEVDPRGRRRHGPTPEDPVVARVSEPPTLLSFGIALVMFAGWLKRPA